MMIFICFGTEFNHNGLNMRKETLANQIRLFVINVWCISNQIHIVVTRVTVTRVTEMLYWLFVSSGLVSWHFFVFNVEVLG